MSMARFSIRFLAGLFGAAACAAAWQDKVSTGSWSGIIINGGCTADEAFAESDKCLERRRSQSRLALYDDTIRQVFDLDAQDQAARYFGESVTVEGTRHNNAIQVSTIGKLTSIGLEPAERAPGFSLPDQFGRLQDLNTLKGSRGTVLLFFRSADW
jgi:hypothetical protein